MQIRFFDRRLPSKRIGSSFAREDRGSKMNSGRSRAERRSTSTIHLTLGRWRQVHSGSCVSQMRGAERRPGSLDPCGLHSQGLRRQRDRNQKSVLSHCRAEHAPQATDCGRGGCKRLMIGRSFHSNITFPTNLTEIGHRRQIGRRDGLTKWTAMSKGRSALWEGTPGRRALLRPCLARPELRV